MIVRQEGPVERFADAVGTRLDRSPLALLLDIDGTLAPIAPRPEDARIPEPTRDALGRLAALPGVVVALVSGRAADDALRMIGIDGVWIIGNHGLELRTAGGDLVTDDVVRRYENAISRAARELAPLERTIKGAIVENKRFGLSVHYRLAEPDAVPTLIQRTREVAQTLGLWVLDGKKIVELRPPVHVDKGTATVALADRLGALRDGSVFFAGDDRTDEDAFRALRLRDANAVTVRIIAADDRNPANTEAEFTLPSPDEVRQVLEWLAARRSAVAGD